MAVPEIVEEKEINISTPTIWYYGLEPVPKPERQEQQEQQATDKWGGFPPPGCKTTTCWFEGGVVRFEGEVVR